MVTSLLRRGRMHRHGAVEIVLGQPGLQRDAEKLRHLAGIGPKNMRAEHQTRFRRRRPASSASSRRGRQACCASAGRSARRFRGRRNRLAASSSERPTVPISGCENTAVAMQSWSGSTGLSLNAVSMKHIASWIATGVSCTRSVTSPIAQMFSTLVRDSASTMISPLIPVSTPAASRPRFSVFGMRPMASMTWSATRTSPP